MNRFLLSATSMSESAIHNESHKMSSRTAFLAALLIAALLALTSYFLFSARRTSAPILPPAESEIDAKFAALRVQPHTVELTTEKALNFRAAIKQADFGSATTIATQVLAGSHVENWRFHPFGQFMDGLSDLADPACTSRKMHHHAVASRSRFSI